jgi:hypothetical protein
MWDELHVANGWWISSCCIEPRTPIHICEEIDGNRSSATSPTKELTLIKICSKLLDANLSQGRINPLDSLHLCQNDEQLGRWSWLKVEKKDRSGTSRMVHSMCHNCGGLKFSVLPAQNFTRENIIAAGCFADYSLVMLCFHTAQDWKVFNKVMQSPPEYSCHSKPAPTSAPSTGCP